MLFLFIFWLFCACIFAIPLIFSIPLCFNIFKYFVDINYGNTYIFNFFIFMLLYTVSVILWSILLLHCINILYMIHIEIGLPDS